MKVDGRCHCGQIRYEAQIDPATKIYVKTAESGNRRAQGFCADCGTPLYSADAQDPQVYFLRVGTLSQRAALPPTRQIWCQSALPWASDIRNLAPSERA